MKNEDKREEAVRVSTCLEKTNKNSPHVVTTLRMRSACLCDLAFLACERLATLLLVRNVPSPNTDTHYPEVVVLVVFLLSSFSHGTVPSYTTFPIQLPLIMTTGLTI